VQKACLSVVPAGRAATPCRDAHLLREGACFARRRPRETAGLRLWTGSPVAKVLRIVSDPQPGAPYRKPLNPSSTERETFFQELKRYVRFTDEDARLLTAIHPTVSPHFAGVAQQFYDRIREHERAHALLTGEEQIIRLQGSLVRWLHRVFLGPHDEGYFAETSHIGRVHVKVGLPEQYMFAAMAVMRSSL
jgi:hypothetical protein